MIQCSGKQTKQVMIDLIMSVTTIAITIRINALLKRITTLYNVCAMRGGGGGERGEEEEEALSALGDIISASWGSRCIGGISVPL